MRTKTKAVRRNSSEQLLEDVCSVSAEAGVGSVVADVDLRRPLDSQTLVDASIDVDTLLDPNSGSVTGMMDAPTCVSDGIIIHDADFRGFMDVDASPSYTGALPEGLLSRVDVTGMLMRLSNGITIGELDPARAMGKARHHQFPASMDVVGKGKRKVDDMPMFTENDSHAVDRCVGDSSPAAYIPAEVGVGSSKAFIPIANEGLVAHPDAHHRSDVRYACPSNTHECDLRGPVTGAFPSGVHP